MHTITRVIISHITTHIFDGAVRGHYAVCGDITRVVGGDIA